jgi:transposase
VILREASYPNSKGINAVTVPHIVDPAGLPSEALAEASPDLMRPLLRTMINRFSLGFVLSSNPGWSTVPRKFGPEMKARALRMLAESMPDHENKTEASRHGGGLLGISPETLRTWVRQEAIDASLWPGGERCRPVARSHHRC